MMKASTEHEVAVQRAYYRRTAVSYDEKHEPNGEHSFALAFLLSMIGFLGIRSVLDVGSGTGRALLELKAAYPDLKVTGIEPSRDLREIGYAKGLSPDELIEGDAQRIGFADGSFDVVCEFGALHHMPHPSKAVAEMLRVASKAIFISDGNNFGQGSAPQRMLKQVLRAAGLWKAFDFVKTRGKGYLISEGDGLYYSYSVFSDYQQIAKCCRRVHLLNTVASGPNPARSASHIGLLGIK